MNPDNRTSHIQYQRHAESISRPAPFPDTEKALPPTEDKEDITDDGVSTTLGRPTTIMDPVAPPAHLQGPGPYPASGSRGRHSELDWVVPLDRRATVTSHRPRTIAERLGPTIDIARTEKDKYVRKAWITGVVLNVAIGAQVLLGALTTGLSASQMASRSIAILGGLSTLVASYLARARGTNEPELSIARTKDLEQFIRECDSYILDYGHLVADQEHDQRIEEFRTRFEGLLGNNNNEERRLAPPV